MKNTFVSTSSTFEPEEHFSDCDVFFGYHQRASCTPATVALRERRHVKDRIKGFTLAVFTLPHLQTAFSEPISCKCSILAMWSLVKRRTQNDAMHVQAFPHIKSSIPEHSKLNTCTTQSKVSGRHYTHSYLRCQMPKTNSPKVHKSSKYNYLCWIIL